MKFWARFFSLFSCLVLLFAVFSLPVLAADNGTEQKVNIYCYSPSSGIVIGQADVLEGETASVAEMALYHSTEVDFTVTNRMIIRNVDGSALFKADSDYTLRIDGLYFSIYNDEIGAEYIFGDDVFEESQSTWSYVLEYTDGTTYRSGILSTDNERLTVNTQTFYHSYKFDYPASDKEVYRITIYEYMVHYPEGMYDDTHSYFEIHCGIANPLNVIIEEEDKSETLLGGLLDWVKDIGSSVSDTFETVSSGFANIGTWFAELPTKIWEVMSEGIKGLFVPDEEYMASYSDKWDELLSDRLGAVYQVCDITLSSWDSIMSADETNTIEFPEVTIPLPDNNSFSFGGYDVKIVPDGFTALAEAVKLAVGILCTYLFVNGLLKRYEEVMGVRE